MIGYIPTAILNLCVQCFVSTGKQKCSAEKLCDDIRSFCGHVAKMKNITGLFVVENNFSI